MTRGGKKFRARDFLSRVAEKADPRRAWLALRRNFLLKLLSVLAAFSLWLFVNAGARDAEIALQVPVRIHNIPSDLTLVGPRLDFVDVRVSGPRTILGTIERDRLAVSLDLRGVRAGPAVFRIGPESLDLPRGVRVTLINPSRIDLELERLERKLVPVRVQLDGRLPSGWKARITKVEPPAVEIRGPVSQVSAVQFVEAEPVAVTASESGMQEVETAVRSPAPNVTLNPPRIRVGLAVAEETLARPFRRRVEVRGDATGVRIVPEEVEVEIEGPASLLRELDPAQWHVYVDAGAMKAGQDVVKPEVVLPPSFRVVRLEPETVRWEVAPRASPTPAGP
ncbi:MAG: hypothetical protein KatS3mg076_0288 [Candidatus Binatia bacterium]|nr:MAG: hypothetical protein KatS3mg076_0288 [Candidatus Binatia bacterium]